MDLLTKPHISPELLELVDEEKQVIIHCHMTATDEEDAARIWPSTYIISNQNGYHYPLVHAEGIRMYPRWTPVKLGETLNFTLIFKGLPKDCLSFDFVEIIPEPGGFSYGKIPRNESDVYHLNF